MDSQALLRNITHIRDRVSDKSAKTPITSKPVTIVAASKTQSAEVIRSATRFGVNDFGENYLQEALVKMDLLRDLNLTWHFIGPLQSNKTKLIAEKFNWVHSLDRLSVAKQLSKKRPAELDPLNVCIQVNISNEISKSGCLPEEVSNLILDVRSLPRLRLRGLMIIPEAIDKRKKRSNPFERVRRLFDTCTNLENQLDTLSMGMSGDFELAIEHGSTMIRLGTALFGPRNR